MLSLLDAAGLEADDDAVCAMAAVVEYICAEILDLGGKNLKDDHGHGGDDRPPLVRAMLCNDAVDGVVRVEFDDDAAGEEAPGWYDISEREDDMEDDKYLCRRHLFAAIDKDERSCVRCLLSFKASNKRKGDADS